VTNYKASPRAWTDVYALSGPGRSENQCILELRARVEALEANSNPTSNPSQIRKSLVERVQGAIHDVEFPHGNDEACAAIREVLAWLKEGEHTWAALKLELEASP
jgi:hypothetical protein